MKPAAAAACLLAHQLLVWHGRQADAGGADIGTHGAAQLINALARPGMLHALTACRSGEHAAGGLVLAAVQCLRPHTPNGHMLPGTSAAALAPTLPAALHLAASGAHETASDDLRSGAAADLLWTLTEKPATVQSELADALPAAGRFLTRLHDRLQETVHRLLDDCRVGDCSGASTADATADLSESLDLQASTCHTAVSGTLRLLALYVQRKDAGDPACPSMTAAATAAADAAALMMQRTCERLAALPPCVDGPVPPRLLLRVAAPNMGLLQLAAALHRAAGCASAALLYSAAIAAMCHLLRHRLVPAGAMWMLAHQIHGAVAAGDASGGPLCPSAEDVAVCAAVAHAAQLELAELRASGDDDATLADPIGVAVFAADRCMKPHSDLASSVQAVNAMEKLLALHVAIVFACGHVIRTTSRLAHLQRTPSLCWRMRCCCRCKTLTGPHSFARQL